MEDTLAANAPDLVNVAAKRDQFLQAAREALAAASQCSDADDEQPGEHQHGPTDFHRLELLVEGQPIRGIAEVAAGRTASPGNRVRRR
jgi:hypothetical protein